MNLVRLLCYWMEVCIWKYDIVCSCMGETMDCCMMTLDKTENDTFVSILCPGTKNCGFITLQCFFFYYWVLKLTITCLQWDHCIQTKKMTELSRRVNRYLSCITCCTSDSCSCNSLVNLPFSPVSFWTLACPWYRVRKLLASICKHSITFYMYLPRHMLVYTVPSSMTNPMNDHGTSHKEK